MLKKNIHLFKLFGIPVGMNWSFLAVIVAFGFFYGVWMIPVYLLLALSIVAHEFGHALTGRRWFGTRCQYISLHALGGVAMMDVPKTPKGEFWVSLAGPVVSLAIAILLMPLVWLTQSWLLYYVMVINFWVALFNFAPALPMDGGRMFRAVLSKRIGHYRATKIALYVSRLLVGGALILGILHQLWVLLLIAAFVLVLGFAEEHQLENSH